MRPASESILSAVERAYLHEDRLTEVLACVAQVNAKPRHRDSRWRPEAVRLLAEPLGRSCHDVSGLVVLDKMRRD
jgi:hypothetical protein